MSGIIESSVTNPRGIPTAPFVEDVEKFAPTRAEIAPALQKFQEMIAKYKFMEDSTARRLTSLHSKIPEISKTLDTVQFLHTRRGSSEPDSSITTTFELNDTLFAKASVPTSEEKLPEVYLWLGANVMLAYPLDEAEELLKGKLKAAKLSAKNCEEDLEFLKKQVTTLEVNVARVYNHEVGMKRREREEEEASRK